MSLPLPHPTSILRGCQQALVNLPCSHCKGSLAVTPGAEGVAKIQQSRKRTPHNNNNNPNICLDIGPGAPCLPSSSLT
eukprot:1145448-Pelagomonas_calceolata.AAC.6